MKLEFRMKIRVAIAAMAGALMLAACSSSGGDEPETPSTPTTSVASSPTSETTTPAEETTSAGTSGLPTGADPYCAQLANLGTLTSSFTTDAGDLTAKLGAGDYAGAGAVLTKFGAARAPLKEGVPDELKADVDGLVDALKQAGEAVASKDPSKLGQLATMATSVQGTFTKLGAWAQANCSG
jgi:hypothetical protein